MKRGSGPRARGITGSRYAENLRKLEIRHGQVRTPACHTGGFEFEPHRSRFPFCPVAVRAVREIDDLREAAQFARMEVRMNSIVLHSSVPPDNEHRLIINAILFANLAQMIIFFYSVFAQCIAD